MGVLLFFGGAPTSRFGAVSLPLSFTATTATDPNNGRISLPITFGRTTTWQSAQPATAHAPTPTFAVAFDSPPLASSPAWEEVGDRIRVPGVTTQRGRSYEFDRMETGTMRVVLNNRDAALSPENTASPYNPIRSTRPARAYLSWGQPYPLFRGITEGFPQAFPSLGLDALVELRVNDLFYALNNARFSPGSTTLASALAGGVAQNTEETITVLSTELPLPQVAPFTITVAGLTDEWPVETMTVEEIVDSTTYRVTRTDEITYEHPAGAAILTTAVSFDQEMSGTRIARVLEAVGFDSEWYDLDEGQSLIAPSSDLAQVNPLEHINLIAAAEFGRFFVSREGRFTFRDRHSVIVDSLTPAFTFTDVRPLPSDGVPYTINGALEHSDEKLYNRVRITIVGGDYDGQVVDVSDAASIAQHFERIFEREFPYANLNDAESAAQYVLTNSSQDTLRLPELSVKGAYRPSTLWPLLLAREIGDRVSFRYQPEGGGDLITTDLIIESISHAFSPEDHVMQFQCTEVTSTQYWILGRAGYSELGSTTRVGF